MNYFGNLYNLSFGYCFDSRVGFRVFLYFIVILVFIMGMVYSKFLINYY